MYVSSSLLLFILHLLHFTMTYEYALEVTFVIPVW